LDLNKLQLNKKLRILITGCAGFIGSHLMEFFLKKGLSVKGFDNFSTGSRNNINEALKEASDFYNNPEFNLVEGDIRDYNQCIEATRHIDIVLHHAALGSVQRSIENPKDSSEVNIEGSLNLLKASVENKIKRFIYASSSSLYGDTETLPKTEDMPPNPRSIYAVTKLAAEYYVRLYYSLFGLNTVSLRYFNVFGTRQSPDSIYSAVIPKFVKKIMNSQKPEIYGDGNQSRDFTYIDNVLFANYLAITSENKNIFGNFYNIACSKRISLNEIIYMLSDLKQIKITPLYLEKRKGDVLHSQAGIKKAKTELEYSPVIFFKEGLEKYLDISKF
jgi:UDP-N-acetylglucosamine/UDP-N-acetylgalactosamine 4-epimerase